MFRWANEPQRAGFRVAALASANVFAVDTAGIDGVKLFTGSWAIALGRQTATASNASSASMQRLIMTFLLDGAEVGERC